MATLFDPFDPIGTLRQANSEPPVIVGEDGTVTTSRDPLDEPPVRPITWPFRIGLVIGLSALLIRVTTLAIVDGSRNKVLAEGNRIRTVTLDAPRGLIVDRHARPLATNDATFSLTITPADLPGTSAERSRVYQTLSQVTGTAEADLKRTIETAGLYSLQPVEILTDLTHEASLALALKTKGLPGVAVASRAVRQYETVGALAHVLGYTGRMTEEDLQAHPDYFITSRIGKVGIEASYDQVLRGVPGTESVEVNAQGSIRRIVDTVAPTPGKTIELGIDLELQKAATEALKAKIDEKAVTSGAIIGIDPRDGTVRILVSLPDYDNNLFSHPVSSETLKKLTNDPNHPFTNRVTSGLYPPGSTIKPVVAVGGLANGVIRRETTIDAPGSITVAGQVFPDWKTHGLVNVERALAVSSDVFFYAVGGGWGPIGGLGIDRLDQTYRLFGLGQPTGIDLPGESSGLLPTPIWKLQQKRQPWYIGDTYHIAIGQGFMLTTPLQLAHTVATIANGGTRYAPHVVSATIDPITGNRVPVEPTVVAKDFQPSSAFEIVRQGMRQTVEDGSGRGVNDLAFPIAGKTGTAQFNNNAATHAWFASFAPFNSPELALIVLVEGGGEGNEAAVPVARSIYQWIADHGFNGDK